MTSPPPRDRWKRPAPPRPGTPQAEEADGLIYEITYLSVGLRAPAISGKPRNARRAITLDSFRGKPIVLVFWAST